MPGSGHLVLQGCPIQPGHIAARGHHLMGFGPGMARNSPS